MNNPFYRRKALKYCVGFVRLVFTFLLDFLFIFNDKIQLKKPSFSIIGAKVEMTGKYMAFYPYSAKFENLMNEK